jgi:hypothetical protein
VISSRASDIFRLSGSVSLRSRTAFDLGHVDDGLTMVVKNGAGGDGSAGEPTTTSQAPSAAAIANASVRPTKRLRERRVDSMGLAIMVSSVV